MASPLSEFEHAPAVTEGCDRDDEGGSCELGEHGETFRMITILNSLPERLPREIRSPQGLGLQTRVWEEDHFLWVLNPSASGLGLVLRGVVE